VKIDQRWDALSEADWRQFVACWFDGLAERDEGSLPPLPKIIDEDHDAGQYVVQMNFTASHENQWKFIETAFDMASCANLGDIAAGPIEHILWKHGDIYIDRIEAMSESNPQFAAMMAECWQHKMSDSIWKRVQTIQNRSKV